MCVSFPGTWRARALQPSLMENWLPLLGVDADARTVFLQWDKICHKELGFIGALLQQKSFTFWGNLYRIIKSISFIWHPNQSSALNRLLALFVENETEERNVPRAQWKRTWDKGRTISSPHSWLCVWQWSGLSALHLGSLSAILEATKISFQASSWSRPMKMEREADTELQTGWVSFLFCLVWCPQESV